MPTPPLFSIPGGSGFRGCNAGCAAAPRPRWCTTITSRRIVTNGGAHATLVPDVPVIFENRQPFPRTSQFTVAVVCSFNYDEPLPAIIEAATQLPDVRFFVTGNPKHLDQALKARMPGNMELTGFFSTEAYGGLIAGADAVLTLTTRDHTMLRGAYEAIYQGTPVIVSDWALLREAFPEGAIHVDNSPASIAAGVRALAADPEAYRRGASRMADTKHARWSATRRELTEIMNLPGREPRRRPPATYGS